MELVSTRSVSTRSVSQSRKLVSTRSVSTSSDVEDQHSDSNDDDDDDDSSGHKCCNLRRRCCYCLCFTIILAVLLVVVAFASTGGLKPAKAFMTNMAIDEIDIPGLGIEGLASADTSACPPLDPCGTDCSKCPAGYINRGCVCAPPQPGSVTQSNHSACPSRDPCGLLPPPIGGKGCSTCPDSTWTNMGCTCDQPVTMDQVFDKIHDFADLITGQDEFPMKLVVSIDALLCNPNIIGADTDPGVFELLWKDNILGTANVEQLDISPMSSQNLTTVMTIDKVTTDVGTGMLSEALSREGELTMRVRGNVTMRFAAFPVVTTMACDITVNVLQGNKIVDKNCSYHIASLSLETHGVNKHTCT